MSDEGQKKGRNRRILPWAIFLILGIGATLLLLPMGVGVREASRRAKAAAMMKVIDESLERYRMDNGDYPRPFKPYETVTIDGVTMQSGAARALYQALSGDGDDALVGGSEPSNGISENEATIYWQDIADPLYTDSTVRKGLPVAKTAEGLMLVDPWGRPWQYVLFDPEMGESLQNTNNMTYDLWSFGTDKNPGNDPEGKAKWITNY